MSQAAAQKPASTRERLLELAEQQVLQKGFAATSIEELIAGVGITKSGFFYHFKDKTTTSANSTTSSTARPNCTTIRYTAS
jgi:AcrR family transcriptional regulator